MPQKRRALIAVSMLAAMAVLATSGCAAWRIGESRELARESEPFQAAPPQSTASLLVVGDSTAVGTGASSPAASLPGLIARDHPRLRVVNFARDGAKFADIEKQLQGTAERFDAVLVLGGGNDVIRLTNEDELRATIGRVAQLARQRSGNVTLMPAGNVGNAPFFFPPTSWLMTRRSQHLHDMVREAAQATGASYVNLYKPKDQDPFARRPKEMHAKDGLHPSDEGYRSWYGELKAQSKLVAGVARS